ncbi:lipase family protein [Thalassotalea fonticola]|uniref:Lipase family protein n=1 Tax=Thalassotalea fonticola TaxID=3065649 RepID=A0ABZ0GTF1_9GAMM|nr:lipase family protein [Colwelliaceae bacterium S1-1]
MESFLNEELFNTNILSFAIVIEVRHLVYFSPLFLLLIVSIVKSYKASISTKSAPSAFEFFKYKHLRALPLKRIGYSDRLAYLLAELSALAYIKFEGEQNTETHENNANNVASSKEFIETTLANNHFSDISFFDHGPLEGFSCVSTLKENQEPFLVIVFRGSEKKIDDWLTNADVLPVELKQNRSVTLSQKTTRENNSERRLVHRGFYKSFTKSYSKKTELSDSATNTTQTSIKDELQSLINQTRTKHGELAVYFTGHSLGAAWATIATNLLTVKAPCACYNYGCPRLANYGFYLKNKHPIYRIVNSADIVTRVPPGPTFTFTMLFMLKSLKYLTGAIPLLTRLFSYLISFSTNLKITATTVNNDT